MWDVCHFLKAFRRETWWGRRRRRRHKVTGRKREGEISPEDILSIVMFSVLAQEDSHKNTMFTHFPSLSGACGALASIIGSEAVSPYPFHCVCVCFSPLVFPAQKATRSASRSPFARQAARLTRPSDHTASPGLWSLSSWPPVLTEEFFFCPLPNNKHCWHQLKVHGFSVIPCS